jgi:hypothetical protein
MKKEKKKNHIGNQVKPMDLFPNPYGKNHKTINKSNHI